MPTGSSGANQRLFQQLQMCAGGACIAISVVSVLVLAGWAIDNEFLKSFLHPAHVAMNPWTAIGFLLCCTSLWLQRQEHAPNNPRRRVAMGCAAAATLIALIILPSLYLPWKFQLDEVLFRSQLALRAGGNRMAPKTAIAFIFSGSGLVLMQLPGRAARFLGQCFTLVTLVVALLALTMYFFLVGSYYRVSAHVPMALNTASCFFLLALGMLSARPEREPLRTVTSDGVGGLTARRLLPWAFAIPLLLGWVPLGLLHQRAGMSGEAADTLEYGLSLFALGNIIAFNALIWGTARRLCRMDELRRTAEAALGESEERHRAVVEQTAEGIYIVDAQTKAVMECNASLLRLLGYGPDDRPALSVYDFIARSRAEVDERFVSALTSRIPIYGELQLRRRDGSLVDVEASAGALSYGGRTVLCTVVRDVTQRKAAERQLREKNVQLEEANVAERQALDALKRAQTQMVQSEKLVGLGQMVAGVAHEINNPLAFVSNNVAVLQRDVAALRDLLDLYREAEPAVKKELPQLLERIQDFCERVDLNYTLGNLQDLMTRSRDGLKRIQHIVKDLRDFARLDESDLHEVDLNTGIESTVNIIGPKARGKNVTLHLDLRPLPLVACFPAKLNQVVMNLVSNAIDACATGGEVTVRSFPGTPPGGTSDTDGGEVRIQVLDNGSGIPEEIRQRIFDPFFTTKPQGEGTGLGLSISYGIVQDHGGVIEVESEIGKGTCFTVRVPVRGPVMDANEQGRESRTV